MSIPTPPTTTTLYQLCSLEHPGLQYGIRKGKSKIEPKSPNMPLTRLQTRFLDFLSAYSAVNQGHCHPELIKALTEQASRLTLSSRAFYNDVFPRFAEFVTKFFGFDMVLPMNTGAEAVETGLKIARKWGYKIKGIPQNEALVMSVAENFHGRTVYQQLLAAIKHEKLIKVLVCSNINVNRLRVS